MSNPLILSNSQSPALNALAVKASNDDFSYKIMKSISPAVSKQRREINIPNIQFGGSYSVNLLKYGLVNNVYLKLVVTHPAADNKTITWRDGGILKLFKDITLTSHSRVIERLDNLYIQQYVLERAPSDNSAILSYTGFNTHDSKTVNTNEGVNVYYIPLPFSFFNGLSKAKDALHLQNMAVNFVLANSSEAVQHCSKGTSPKDFTVTEMNNLTFTASLIQNYYEMDQASTNKLWEKTYNASGPINQLYTQTYKEATKTFTISDHDTQVAEFDITTKNVIVRSYVQAFTESGANNKEIEPVAIDEITVSLNGVDYYACSTVECNFEKLLSSDTYNRMSKILTGGHGAYAEYYPLYEVDFRIIDMPACDKFSSGLSAKNVSAPMYKIKFAANNTVKVNVVHEVLNIVQFSKADGSMTSVLSV